MVNNRKGNRKDRNSRFGTRKPVLGYYLIVTDTEKTEEKYFEGLRDSLPEQIRDKIVISVHKTSTERLVNRCKELCAKESQYRIPWIVFDRDRVSNFDQIIQKAENNGINVGWSNPCIEIWFYAYFGELPTLSESTKCCRDFGNKYFKVTGQEYSKSNDDVYGILKKYGDEGKAIELMRTRHNNHILSEKKDPSEMCPCSTVYKLVEEITRKIDNS